MSTRTDLCVYGYIRHYWNIMWAEVPFPPHDVIMLFSQWITLLDTWDRKNSNSNFTLSPCTIIKGIQTTTIDTLSNSTARSVSAFGIESITKPLKTTWSFIIPNQYYKILLI